MSFTPKDTAVPATCGVSPRTVGYVVKAVGLGKYFYSDEYGRLYWASNHKTVYPTISAAIAAIIADDRNLRGSQSVGLTILKVVETTYTETKTEYHAL